jgi:Holliday junction resolvase RusA-like endonuclease
MTKSFDLVKDAIAKNGDALFHFYVKVPKHIVKKNRRPIKRNWSTGKPFLGKSNELMGAENKLVDLLRLKIMREPQFKTISKPIWCVFLFYFPEKDFVVKNGARKGLLSGRLPDLSNLIELPADALQKSRVIENDNLICSLDLSRRLPGPCAALEIFIFEYVLEQAPRLQVVP